MSILDSALALADKGFYIFPLMQNSKKPVVQDFENVATRDHKKIREWWARNTCFNIGIYTGKYNGEGESLVGIDVDNKGDKKGNETLLMLELQGLEMPKTFEQITPTEGRHLVYRSKEPVANGVNTLGPGLDVRGKGGYLVGSGSILDGKVYYHLDFEVALITDELLSRFRKAKDKKEISYTPVEIDSKKAMDRSIYYLQKDAPLALQGDGGDHTTFKVACTLKDHGLAPQEAFHLMAEHWNERCQPPWDLNELQTKVENAFRYGQEPPGVKNPEVLFDEIQPADKEVGDPVESLNKNFAFVIVGGKAAVIRERKKGIDFLSIESFHQLLKPKKIMTENRVLQVSQLWIGSDLRRTYDALCFDPSNTHAPTEYNLWRGFKYKPKKATNPEAQKALDTFISHVKENVCHNIDEHFNWLMCFFAHLIQKPYEKPIVSVVLRGRKGVGKNILVETIGALLEENFTLVADSRYLLGNFNSHLEKCLMFVLDEAFWSGSKSAEGKLKDVITGKNHIIERKGYEAYTVKNLTRVFILGNESWLVPASHDERRFAVFDLSNNRRNDFTYFNTIMSGMKNGGYEALADYLLNFDLSKANIGVAPQTSALADQKLRSLPILEEFWFESLRAGRILMSQNETWGIDIVKEDFRQAYKRYCNEKGSTKWLESEENIGKEFFKFAPHVKTKRIGTDRKYAYDLGTLEESRLQWDTHIGHKTNWD